MVPLISERFWNEITNCSHSLTQERFDSDFSCIVLAYPSGTQLHGLSEGKCLIKDKAKQSANLFDSIIG